MYLLYLVTILLGCLSSKQITFLMNGDFDAACTIFPMVNDVVKTILGLDKPRAWASSSGKKVIVSFAYPDP